MKRHTLKLPPQETSTALLLADLQVPFHDKRAWGLALGAAARIKPTYIIGMGDWADCFWWSSYPKQFGSVRPAGLRYGWNAAGERRAVWDTWDQIRTASPESTFIFLEGNHEERCRRIIQTNAPGSETPDTDFSHVFARQKKTISEWWDLVLPYEDALHIGHLWLTHGSTVSEYEAKRMLQNWGTSIAFGHTHRWQFYSRRHKNGEHHAAWGLPCLCDLDAHYLAAPNWCQGFTVVTFSPTGLFHLEIIPILPGYKYVLGQELYK